MMMDAVNKGDSAQFNREEVLNAEDWVLLNFSDGCTNRAWEIQEFQNLKLQLDDGLDRLQGSQHKGNSGAA